MFHRGVRVASHAPLDGAGDGTPPSPSTCRARIAATPTGRRTGSPAKPAEIGPATAALCEAIMRAKPHPEQGFRACLGILRAGQELRPRAPRSGLPRGLSIGAASYGSIASILKTGLDKAFHADVGPAADPIHHGNIRGRGYYH